MRWIWTKEKHPKQAKKPGGVWICIYCSTIFVFVRIDLELMCSYLLQKEKDHLPDVRLSLSDKCQFFNVWFVLTILGTVCLFVVSWMNFINVKSHSPTEDGTLQRRSILCGLLLSNMLFLLVVAFSFTGSKLLSGSGCALIWFSLLRYFEHNRGFYILVATLKRGVPRVARFMVGVMPMMLGK